LTAGAPLSSIPRVGYPSELRYTKDHEWCRVEGNRAVIGITEFAQQQLGDVVFVELPETGTAVTAGEEFGTVESVKAVSELFAPLSGKIIEVNGKLQEDPELINQDPHGEGWMIKIEVTGTIEGLLTAAEYESFVQSAE
jgi:glycine cleavage system H protein